MGEAGGEIVELFPDVEKTDAEAPVRTRPRDPDERFCNHGRLELDTEARRVYCRDCAREVPAFDAMLRFAREWERYVEARKHAKRESRKARQELKDIERLERNAKSRLRTARRKLAADDPIMQMIDRAVARGGYVNAEQLRRELDEAMGLNDVA